MIKRESLLLREAVSHSNFILNCNCNYNISFSMPPSHLHSYPKTFNSWGHLKAFPLRSPVKYNFLYLGFCAMGVFLLIELMTSAVFETFNNSDFLSGDVLLKLFRKLGCC